MLTRWTFLLRRLTLVLALYSLLRALFLLCNYRLFKEANSRDIALAFLQGLRFDLSAVVAINSIFIVMSLLPRRLAPAQSYERMLQWVFLCLNLPFLLLNVVDLEYFQFTGRRSTLALVSMAGDVGVKWHVLLGYYWPLLFLVLALFAVLFFFYGKPVPREMYAEQTLSLWQSLLNFVIILPLIVIAFRGGVQFRPLNPGQAMPEKGGALSQLALNSSFTLIKSYKKASLARCHWFADDQEPIRFLEGLPVGRKLIPDEPRRDNIIIFILESFSAEYCGAANGEPRYTPFLDSLARRSAFFAGNYANGRRSIEAAPSLLAGFPSLMAESFLESVYQNNELIGLGTFLRPLGYTTSFFHGAANGTMRFDTFMRRAGIDHYYGLNEYPNKRADYDGHWGIFDEPYLQYVASELSRQKQPFAATVFTLSSHQPYSVPAKYHGRFKKGTLAIHESIGYTDFALEQFFTIAQRQPWYSNTLFIITGDHTSKLETQHYLNPLGQYRVPLLLFQPQSKISNLETNRITEHADILPSILDYLQVRPARHLLFGSSIFRHNEGRAFLHANGDYWLVRGEHALQLPSHAPARLYDLNQDPQVKSPMPIDSESGRCLEKEAKALAQYFINGTLANKLYCPTQ